MKNCKKCNGEFEPVKGLKNYCSQKCANTRIHSEETRKKISESLKKSEKFYISERKKVIDREVLREQMKEQRKQQLLSADLSTLKHEGRRSRIMLEQNYCCNKCKLSEWLGQPIMLELEHKDGNNKNNIRENLEALCPNCHSQTEFWRGKNKNKFGIKVREENLLPLILESKTIAEVLRKAGLAEKGNNYKRIRALINKHGLYDKFNKKNDTNTK